MMESSVKSLVCDACWNSVFALDSFQTAWNATSSSDAFSYTTTWKDILDAADRECNWCKILVREIPEYYSFMTKKDYPNPQNTFKVGLHFVQSKQGTAGETLEGRNSISLEIDDVYPLRYEVHATPEDVAACYITARELVWEVASSVSYEQAIECLRVCAQHERCPKPRQAVLPTRVIDCFDTDRPELFITNGRRGFYVALSYVWGEDQPHKTRRNNVDIYVRQGIDVQLIPQTIRDAILSTKRLGLRYLWVDAFCILQDSREDKVNEIARMRSIFRDAYVTVTAASAQKVSEGFLQDRPAPTPPIRLPFRCSDGPIGSMLLRKGAGEPSEPVNTRAWCLEERLLTPRALIYASHTLQYECVSHIVNVGNANSRSFRRDMRLPIKMFQPKPPHSPSEENSLDLRNAWNNVISMYAERALTRPRDRLLALGGVVEEFHRFWNSSRYIAGLWQHNLLEDLLWSKDVHPRYPRPTKYRAPSWSWAAVDGPILPPVSMQITRAEYCRYECEVLHCETTLVSEHLPFGEVTDGYLELSAILGRVVWHPEENALFVKKPLGGGFEVAEQVRIGNAYPDSMEDATEAISQAWAIPIRSSTTVYQMIEGLIVVPASCEEEFRRVGFFVIPMGKPAPRGDVDIRRAWLHTSKRIVKIV